MMSMKIRMMRKRNQKSGNADLSIGLSPLPEIGVAEATTQSLRFPR
jgi:hypothetical protein